MNFKSLIQSPDGLLLFPFGADGPASFNPNSNKLGTNVAPTVLASVASLANVISHYVTKVSGTNEMTGFRLPSGFRGSFVLIPTGIWTLATGGVYASDGTNDDIPIGLAATAVVGKAMIVTTDGLLCYPSYTA